MSKHEERTWLEVVGNRRWIIWFNEDDSNGYRAVGVIEGQRGFFNLGEISNDPNAQPPMYLGTRVTEAHRNCLRWNTKMFGYDEHTQLDILGSSMGAPDFKVVRNGQNDQCVIFRDGDEVLSLDGELAEELWWKLADAFYNFNCDVLPNEGSLRYPEEEI